MGKGFADAVIEGEGGFLLFDDLDGFGQAFGLLNRIISGARIAV